MFMQYYMIQWDHEEEDEPWRLYLEMDRLHLLHGLLRPAVILEAVQLVVNGGAAGALLAAVLLVAVMIQVFFIVIHDRYLLTWYPVSSVVRTEDIRGLCPIHEECLHGF